MAMTREQEVERQLNNMINFIMEEAKEKADEIRIKGDEEFSIEKTNIIQAAKQKINEDFENKCKALDVERRITYSNHLNKSRLAQLRSKEVAIQDIFNDVQNQLVSLTSNEEDYKKLLEQLILQGLVSMREQEVSIVCREQDKELVEHTLSAVSSQFKELTGIQPKLTISEEHKLAPAKAEGKDGVSCSGGVVLSARQGRIMSNNTLEQRLVLASENMLPLIRNKLFGRSETRKFVN